MIKKYLITLFISLLLNSVTCSADTNSAYKMGTDDVTHLIAKNSNLKKGIDATNQAKKFQKKGKIKKAKKRYNDAIKFFTQANEENPSNPNILNYLGFSYSQVNDFLMAEIYFTEGLEIEPKHIGLNEYLGYLYVETNRINKAKERLKVLKNCNCEEFKRLDSAIKQITS